MASITIQYFAQCPHCLVVTGINPVEPTNIVITNIDTKIVFKVICQNCKKDLTIRSQFTITEVVQDGKAYKPDRARWNHWYPKRDDNQR